MAHVNSWMGQRHTDRCSGGLDDNKGIPLPGGLGRANGMNEETRKKYQRLNDRLNELNMLNGNIAKLAFYLNENDVDNVDRSILNLQLKFMREYLKVLQDRIVTGCY